MADVSSYDVTPGQTGGHGGAPGHHVHDADGQLVHQRVVVRVAEVDHRVDSINHYENLSFLDVSCSPVLAATLRTLPA